MFPDAFLRETELLFTKKIIIDHWKCLFYETLTYTCFNNISIHFFAEYLQWLYNGYIIHAYKISTYSQKISFVREYILCTVLVLTHCRLRIKSGKQPVKTCAFEVKC